MRRTTMLTGAAALGIGVLALGPLRAAADSDDWFDDVLAELVDDGTLTAEQATAVDEAVTAARPGEQWRDGPGGAAHDGRSDGRGDGRSDGRGDGRGGAAHHAHRGVHHLGWGAPLDAAAEAIGVDPAELLEQLRAGQTIAHVAAANGVDVDAVIDAMVAAAEERLDDAVASGRIDEADAAARRAELRERITEHVNDGPARDRDRRRDGDPTTDPTVPTTESTPATTG